MQAEIALPPGLMNSERLADLRDLTQRPGPFASVYVQLEPHEADADHRLDVRWRQLRDELAESGAPTDVLRSLDSALAAHEQRDGGSIALIATAGEEPMVETLGPTLHRSAAAWAPLPVLQPIMAARQRAVPHVLVLVDRTGADIIGVAGDREVGRTEVQGDSSPIEKNAPGGWSQPRYQRRAETSWEENAAQVADEVAEVVQQVEPRFVAVGGDVRMLGLLRDALRPEIAELVREIGGTRHPDGSTDAAAIDLTRLVDTAAAEITVAVLRETRAQIAAQGNAVRGADEVIPALAAGQVAALSIHEDPDDTRTAWFGPEPMQVGLSRSDLEAMGVQDAFEGRVLDVAVRAALGSSAAIHVVPETTGDISALLRWTS